MGIFRLGMLAGRMAARAAQPGQPGAQFGIFGKTVCWLLIIAAYVHWLRVSLIITGVAVFFVVPAAIILGKGEIARRDRAGRAKLEDLEKRYGGRP